MKILWIVNFPLKALSEKLYGQKRNGLWMDALIADFENNPDYKLVVATTEKLQKAVKVEADGITYYALPSDQPAYYNEDDARNLDAWKKLIDEEKPDLIQIWGTEFTHGLCALRAAGAIPSVIYMQGYLGSIARHYLAGMSYSDIKKNRTIRDVFSRDGILQQQKKYYKWAEKEKETYRRAGRIISETEWCNNSIRSIVPDIKIYSCPLSINQVFAQSQWDIKKAEPHSIICNASGYPLKGLHMALKAVAILKKKYPDVKLYVPGSKMVLDNSIRSFLKKRGYSKYIERLIRDLDIADNVAWIGRMSQEDLSEYYKKARAFVLCSAIENHSSSLKEAMMIGTPSVASAVGGIPEYVRHKENAFLYRFEEYEILATYVAQLFDDDDLAVKISKAGRDDMIKLHGEDDIYGKIIETYHNILAEK